MVKHIVERHGKQAVALISLILIIVFISFFVKSQQLAVNYFIPLLYAIPVVFATYLFDLPGGLTTALVVNFLCIPLIVNNKQPWLENVVMVEMISFFIVSYITHRYIVQRRQKIPGSSYDVRSAEMFDEEEMERGLQRIEPIIKADRERVAFCQVVANIYAFHSLEEKLGVILNILKNEFSCQSCSILLIDNQKKELKVKISRGLSGSFLKQVHLDATSGVWKEVIKNRREVLIERDKTETSNVLEKEFQTFLALPLISRRQILGVMHLESTMSAAFHAMDIEIAWDFANLTAILIDNAKLLEENRHLAIIDQNTGLFNYHYFHQKVLDCIKTSKRYSKSFSLILVELVNYYNFKSFHGKEKTNEALQEMGTVTKSCLRGVDLATRISEKEFCFVLPETDLKGALISAERIEVKVGEQVFGSLEPDILACQGIVEFPHDGETIPALLEKARVNIRESCRAKRIDEEA